MQMKIFTYVFNNPKYLIYQNKCLRKFVAETFEFICLDNSKEVKYHEEFKKICQEHNITYIMNAAPDHSLEGTSHQAALKWSWDAHIKQTQDIIVMLDHDMFAIKPLSFLELLNQSAVAGGKESRGQIEYLHPALMIFNTSEMSDKETINFRGGVIEGQQCDSGGELYYYFQKHPELKITALGHGHLSDENPLASDLIKKYNCNPVFEIWADKFFHPRNGSNWDRVNPQAFATREKLVFELLDRNLNT